LCTQKLSPDSFGEVQKSPVEVFDLEDYDELDHVRRDLCVEFLLALCCTRAGSSVLTLASTSPANALHHTNIAGWLVVIISATIEKDSVRCVDDGVRVTLEGEDI